jgi:hypothetical protein
MEKGALIRSAEFPNHARTGKGLTVWGERGKELARDLNVLNVEPCLFHPPPNGLCTLRVVSAWRVLRGDADDFLEEFDEFSAERFDGIADQPRGFVVPDPAHFGPPATLGHQIPASGLTLIRTRFV